MPTDPRETEFIDKVRALIAAAPFSGDWEACFDHYAGGSRDLTEAELMVLLEDAGIGSWWSRRGWAGRVMQRVDSNGDRVISLAELRARIEV